MAVTRRLWSLRTQTTPTTLSATRHVLGLNSRSIVCMAGHSEARFAAPGRCKALPKFRRGDACRESAPQLMASESACDELPLHGVFLSSIIHGDFAGYFSKKVVNVWLPQLSKFKLAQPYGKSQT